MSRRSGRAPRPRSRLPDGARASRNAKSRGPAEGGASTSAMRPRSCAGKSPTTPRTDRAGMLRQQGRRRHRDGGGRDVEGDVAGRAPARAQRPDEDARLARQAAADLDERGRVGRADAGDDRGGVALEQRALGPRQVILVEIADGVEEATPDVVVEVLGGNAARSAAEPGAHVGGHGRERVVLALVLEDLQASYPHGPSVVAHGATGAKQERTAGPVRSGPGDSACARDPAPPPSASFRFSGACARARRSSISKSTTSPRSCFSGGHAQRRPRGPRPGDDVPGARVVGDLLRGRCVVWKALEVMRVVQPR